MPTENSELVPEKVFVQTNENAEQKELKAIDISVAESNEDDAIDAMRYGIKGITSGEISMTIEIPKEKVRHILKMHGLNKITRKRFKKLLMSCGMQRNDAEIVANAFRESEIQYTPLAVQKVIETINEEAEKEENR